MRAEPKLKHQFNVREISFQLGCLSLVRNKLLHEFPLMTSNGLIPGTGHFLGYLIQAVLVRRYPVPERVKRMQYSRNFISHDDNPNGAIEHTLA
ncbi:MAG: hypothetical protein JXQ99_22320 [Hyphomicrobiaceae bacterium]